MDQAKRGRGQHGPIKYFTEEERKEAIKQSKSEYMLNKDWYCIVCPNHNKKPYGFIDGPFIPQDTQSKKSE